MGEYFVETYRGCEIWMLTPPDYPDDVYHSPCVAGYFSKKSAVKRRICEKTGGTWVDGKCTTPAPPPPPPDEEPHRVETYRGVDIWYGVTPNMYTGQVAPGYLASGWTLQECRTKIDEYLEFLNPPEEPEEGLLAQVVAAVKVWFNENIGTRLQPVYDWIDARLVNARLAWEGLVADANAVIAGVSAKLNSLGTELRGRWDAFATETLPGILDTITAKVGEVSAALDQAKTNLTSAIDTGLADMTSYVDNAVAGVDAVGFFKDPLGYIGTAFNNLIDAWVHGLVKSFGEGLQAGLKGSNPGPRGPGRAFMLGFRETLDEEEGHVSRG